MELPRLHPMQIKTKNLVLMGKIKIAPPLLFPLTLSILQQLTFSPP
jgi:hypothetical protein